jgi:hypothetical protein
MDKEVSAISDFVMLNRRELAAYFWRQLISAGAKEYVDRLGKAGIATLEREAAGLLVDLACALMRRLHPSANFQPEIV